MERMLTKGIALLIIVSFVFTMVSFAYAQSGNTVMSLSTVAGVGTWGFGGDNGPARQAKFAGLQQISFGSDGSLYIAEVSNARIRKVSPTGIVTTVAGTGVVGNNGDGKPATQTQLQEPSGVAVAADGTIYIADRKDARIRKVAPNGIVSTVAGTGVAGYNGDNKPAIEAQLNTPVRVVIGADGSIYVSETAGARIRKITAAGLITTVAGTGVQGFSGDGGLASQAKITKPEGMSFGKEGSLYFAETSGNRVRRILPDGKIETVVASAYVADVAVDASGNLYLAETFTNRIKKVSLAGVVSSFAGSGGSGLGADPASPKEGTLEQPVGIAIAPNGEVHMAEWATARVRKVGICTANDCDSDGLPNWVEIKYRTALDSSDTDGDGLLDAWEIAPILPGRGINRTPGAGFNLDADPEIELYRDDVFAPYADGKSESISKGGRPSTPFTRFVEPPDPRHKDIYLEVDWQDCKEGDCPEIAGIITIDPTHHAPSIDGLKMVIDSLKSDPQITNPDGLAGVNLHILIDERLSHTPNCDRGDSEVRAKYFGTEMQRKSAQKVDLLAARSKVYRYLWSGHSTADYSDCQVPGTMDILDQGTGDQPLPLYDYSPLGESAIGSRDVLVSIGPTWVCPESNTFAGNKVCFRGSGSPIFIPGCRPTIFDSDACYIDSPGIFPAYLCIDGQLREIKKPMHQTLGLGEKEGIAHIWSRSLMRLLANSLGVPENALNLNDPLAVSNVGKPLTRFVLPSSVPYAPPATNGTLPARERYPTLGKVLEDKRNWCGGNAAVQDVTATVMAASSMPLEAGEINTDNTDIDLDGVPGEADNCWQTTNADQSNLDQDPLGDVCDADADGDHREFNGGDPLPLDSDNDGKNNSSDNDDDNDQIDDSSDSCPIAANQTQLDTDLDGVGDACDPDNDGDGISDSRESFTGSNIFSATSVSEYVSVGTTCSDALDNDGDQKTDSADDGCIDSDSDGAADFRDNCPTLANPGWQDTDLDGVGDACDATPTPANSVPIVTPLAGLTIHEGGQFTITAVASDTESSELEYLWDWNGDGIYGESGQDVLFSAADKNGPGEYPLKLQVMDAGGVTVTVTTTITVLNVAPVIQAITTEFAAPWVNFNATMIDPGLMDDHTVLWDWGDGSSAEGSVDNFGEVRGAHLFPGSGRYTVTLTVTDSDGASAQLQSSITITATSSATYLPIITR